MSTSVKYDIGMIREEARRLVQQGHINRYQTLAVLCQFIPPRDWLCMECELENNDFLPWDHIIDLLGHEEWQDD